MKKIILLAAFATAGLVSAKDNEKVDKKKETPKKTEQKAVVRECGVVITYWVGGQVVGTQVVTSDQPDLESCQNFQTGVKLALWAQGYWLS